MPYLVKQNEPRHTRCYKTLPATQDARLGDIYRCDDCAKIYVLRAVVNPFEARYFWLEVSKRKARKLIKRYQKTCREPSSDLGPG